LGRMQRLLRKLLRFGWICNLQRLRSSMQPKMGYSIKAILQKVVALRRSFPKGHPGNYVAFAIIITSFGLALTLWNRPWLTMEDRIWEDLANRKGPDYTLLHKVLQAGDPQKTKTATREQFLFVLEGIQHRNPHVREGAFSGLAFLAREDRFRSEALTALEAIKTDMDTSIAKNYSHYAMLARAPGWEEGLQRDAAMPDEILASRARRDLEFAKKIGQSQ